MRAKALMFLLPGVLLLMLAPLAGCIFSPDDIKGPPPPPPPPAYEFPDTQDKVIKNLREAYVKMDIDGYRNVLHKDYIFKFQQFDIDALGLPSDHLTREEDLESTRKLFSGQPAGDAPAVSGITWSLLEGIGIWETSYNPEFPASQRRLYNFEINITRPGDTTIIVTGQQEFYVASRDSVVDGSPTPYWELLGQVDLSDTGPGKDGAL
jgi:hypothetical protein